MHRITVSTDKTHTVACAVYSPVSHTYGIKPHTKADTHLHNYPTDYCRVWPTLFCYPGHHM